MTDTYYARLMASPLFAHTVSENQRLCFKRTNYPTIVKYRVAFAMGFLRVVQSQGTKLPVQDVTGKCRLHEHHSYDRTVCLGIAHT